MAEGEGNRLLVVVVVAYYHMAHFAEVGEASWKEVRVKQGGHKKVGLVVEVQGVLQNVELAVEEHLCSLVAVALNPLEEVVLPLNLGQVEVVVAVVLSWTLDQLVVEVVAVPSFDETSFHSFAQEEVEERRRGGQEVLEEEDLHVLREAEEGLYCSRAQPFRVLSFLEPLLQAEHFHLKLLLA